MKDYRKIYNHVLNCIEAYDDSEKPTVVGGINRIYEDYKSWDSSSLSKRMNLVNFVGFQKSALIFEYEKEKINELLNDFGCDRKNFIDNEVLYYMTIFPVFFTIWREELGL